MSLIITRRRLLATGTASTLFAPLVARAQAPWPTGTIRIICGTAAGGLTDLFSRAYGEFISRRVGQTVVVENRPGASGGIAAQAVKQAPPDGLTMILTISTTFFANRILISNLQYDPDKDFKVVSIMPAGHLPLVVRSSTGVTNVKEFLAFAEANNVSFGTYGAGSFPHTVAYEFNKLLQRKIVPVHYRGEAPMWNDLSGGALQAAIGSYLGMAGVLQSGAGRAIAVPTAKRMGKLPNVPTFQEQGLNIPVLQLNGWVGLFAPAATPEPTLDRIAELMVEAGKSEAIVKLLDTFGIDEAAMSRKDSQKLYDEEGPVWIESTRQLGITPS
ncbi:Bug family tripartite tricarboxylate transporter substrate binding protein [Phreatobacter aquaticus]|uniref:Bug family tripartite tricarboxylate transporter substrate binding protein n=1 Tax=Phreatobacter aquaticus TaxID=2570229 RepID=UPI00208E42DA|nr:tripartite tricarboxylate transporter substrate binding protein [Phreatobacter aquaticus]